MLINKIYDMKTIKVYLIFALLFANNFIFASSDHAVYSKFISNEVQGISGSITAEIKFRFNYDVNFSNQPVFNLPSGWSYLLINNPTGLSFNQGDSIIIAVQFNYNTANLPFFPKTILYKQEVTLLNNPDIKEFANAEARVYFTPYNSVEIWNISDYYNIPRMWLDNKSNIDSTRTMLLKSSIPQTNLSQSDIITEDWQEDWTFKEVPGLAYLIPMKAVEPDSIILYSDSIGGGEFSDMSKSTYVGTFTGRLVNIANNDLNVPTTIGLGGIRVRLLELDPWGYEVFDETYTNDDGTFTLSYSKWQTFEGGDIELWLQFKSKSIVDNQYKIKAKQDNFWHNIYETKHYLGEYSKTNHTTNLGAYFPDHDAYRSVHWVRNGMKYLRNYFTPSEFKIDIKPFRDDKGTQFMADGLYGISLPLDDPTIYLENEDGDDENDIYHEFGHYIMWELQNKNFILPYEDQNNVGQHSWNRQNGPRFAWSEGWAGFIKAVLDAAYWQQDGEYAHDEGGGNPLIENRINFVDIINGLRSEYYIACALYDMWDGVDKGLPTTMPVGTGETTIHGYNDSYLGGWNDNVSFSFSQIIQPLITHGGVSGKIQNIYEYFSYFLSEQVGENPALRRNMSNCFSNNRVVLDINRYNSKVGNTCMSSDNIANTITDTYTGIIPGIIPPIINISDSYYINLSGINVGVHQTETFNYFFGQGIRRYIVEDLWLGDNVTSSDRTVNLNINTRMLNSSENYYPNDLNGTLYTTNGTDIILKKGTITLGSNTTSANLEISYNSLLQVDANSKLVINDNSIITIKLGGSLHLKAGAIIETIGNGKIQIENGGYLCIENGVNFIGNDIYQSLNLGNGFIVGINPTKGPSTNCMYLFCGIFAELAPVQIINDTYEILNTTNNIYTNNIIVSSGGIFKITNSTLMFSNNSKIIVTNGGKLEINNSILNNINNCDELWQGIYVEYGGSIEVKNSSKIENAINGISTVENVMLKISDSEFKNNITAIYIDGNPAQNSFIKKCNFITTDYLSNIGRVPETFIYLYNVRKLNLLGNLFKNMNPASYYIDERGTGINPRFSGVNVNPFCVIPPFPGQSCANATPCIFENLSCGVYFVGYNGFDKVNINRCQFNNCTRGVYCWNSHNTTLTFNTFNIGEPITDVDPYNTFNYNDELAYGAFFDHSTGYKIEENEFTTQLPNQGIVGLVISESGYINSNQVYRNVFNNLPYAFIAQGINSHYGSTALKIKCNRADNNQYDFVAMNINAVDIDQGDPYNPAGNTFSTVTCTGDGNNFFDGSVRYNYHTGNPLMFPNCVTSDVVRYASYIPFTTFNEVCPSNYGLVPVPVPISDVTLKFAQSNNTLDSSLNAYNNLIDGNKTDWYLKKINQKHNPANLKNKLLEVSPWLSDTVLVSLIKEENYFSPENLTDVLVSNPQSATSPVIQSSLDNMPTPLPLALRYRIDALDSVLSSKTAMDAQISSLINDKEYYANEIINYYLDDTLPASQTSLINFLSSMNTLAYDYKLISYYYTLGQITDARNLLLQLPYKYTFDSTQLYSYNKFKDIYGILLDLKESNLTFYDLTTEQLQIIQSFANDSTSNPGSIAKKIMCQIDSVKYKEWIKLPYHIVEQPKPIFGFLFDSDNCGGNPFINDTIILITELNDTLPLSYAITDNYGMFIFNENEISDLNQEQLVKFETKSGFELLSSDFIKIKDMISQSPFSLKLTGSNLEWSDFYSSVDSLYNGGNAIDLDGNIYVAGFTSIANNTDFLTIKYSPTGQRLWVKTYNGTGNGDDRAIDIAVDKDNNCYVLGTSAGSGSDADIVILKYTSSGSLQWEKRYNGTANGADVAKAISIDQNNNIYVVGTAYGTTNTGNIPADIVTLKYSKNGVLLWTKLYSQAVYEYASDIKVDNSGNSIVLGYGEGYITIKYNANGAQLWVKQYGGGGAYALAVDNSNNIYVIGSSWDINGLFNIVTVKYNSSGIQQWVANTGGRPNDITTDNSGNIYITGSNGYDGFTLKYNSSGIEQWKKIYTSDYYNGIDVFQAIQSDKNNNIYVTGRSATYPYPIKPIRSEIVTIKYDTDGNEKWIEKLNGDYLSYNTSFDMVVSDNLNIYITGLIYDNNLYKMATIKYSQCPATAMLKSTVASEIIENETSNQKPETENKPWLYAKPNPINESSVIAVNTASENESIIEITDIFGRLVKSIKVQGGYNEVQIPRSELSKGIYNISLMQNGQKVAVSVMTVIE